MPKFSYVAIDKDGRERKASIEAYDQNEALKKIKEKGLAPIQLLESNIFTSEINPFKNQRISVRDISIFCRQMASLLVAGIPVIKGMDMLAKQTENKYFQKIIIKTKENAEKGETLASAMSKFPNAFPAILANMVAAGEASGTLDNAFSRMAQHFEKMSKTHSLIKKAMIYPITLAIVAIVVVVVMSIAVVPKFVVLFDDFGAELPLITKAVVAFSDFMINFWWLLALAMMIIIFVAGKYTKTGRGRLTIDTIAIKFPLFGTLKKKSICASFARTMATLISAGVPLADTLKITAKSLDNAAFEKVLISTEEKVLHGDFLSYSLKETGLFPPLVYQMIAVGEETGNIEGMLVKVAEYYEEEVEISSGAFADIMEPLIIVVMGIIIGAIALAIYMPIVSMYGNIQNI